MQNKPTISIIIPAFNEENNIRLTVEEVASAIGNGFGGYEMLIFDDASRDRTGQIADQLALENKNIRVIHNVSNLGLGYNYKKGVELAENDYVIMVPGDNQFSRDSIKKILSLVGRADIIIPYTSNYRIRPLSRQFISRAFTYLINILFGLKIRYYNGTVVHKKELIKAVSISSSGFAYQAEILVRMIKSGRTYKEVGVDILERTHGRSSAFAIKNICSVLKTISKLFIEVHFRK